MAASGSCLSGMGERGKVLGKLLVRRDRGCGGQCGASWGARQVWGSCPPRVGRCGAPRASDDPAGNFP